MVRRSRQYAFIRSASSASAQPRRARRTRCCGRRSFGVEGDVDPRLAVAPVEAGRLRPGGGALASARRRAASAARSVSSTNASYSRSTGTATVFDAVTAKPSARWPDDAQPAGPLVADRDRLGLPDQRLDPELGRRPSGRSRGGRARPRPTRRAGRTTPPSRGRCARRIVSSEVTSGGRSGPARARVAGEQHRSRRGVALAGLLHPRADETLEGSLPGHRVLLSDGRRLRDSRSRRPAGKGSADRRPEGSRPPLPPLRRWREHRNRGLGAGRRLWSFIFAPIDRAHPRN